MSCYILSALKEYNKGITGRGEALLSNRASLLHLCSRDLNDSLLLTNPLVFKMEMLDKKKGGIRKKTIIEKTCFIGLYGI